MKVRLPLFANVYTENLQMKHRPCPKDIIIRKIKLHNLQTRKKMLEN